MEEYSGYVGLDVHKDTIAVAVAWPGRGKPESLGIIANSKRSLLRLAGKLSPNGEVLGFCYEASSCGYEVYRWLKGVGHDCEVVAPSMIPKKGACQDRPPRRVEASVAVSLG